MSDEDSIFSRLTPRQRTLAGLVLALSNFMVVLDLTIANVSVPHISGNLGITPDQGTWIITSYAVAEAICVPLTGWLAQRFGVVKMFIWAMIGFGIFSVLCGLSMSLTMLVACRIGQGLCGGPIMPMSQTLLLRIFPPDQRARAMGLWAMTTLLGPAMGPIIGGYISDNWSWHWIFFINLPIAILCVFAAMALLRPVETETARVPIDKIGLALLVVWVAALQIVLDEGRNHDWFASPMVLAMAIVAVIGFVAFLIYELTEKNPIVDLRIFRHRGFSATVLTYAVGFGAFNATIVILPLWLQQNMGYTATWAGYATGLMGILAVMSAPGVGKAVEKYDPRLIICLGIIGLGLMTTWRMSFNSEVTFFQMAWPTLLTGPFMVMFFVPITGLAIATVNPDETANAAGMSNFLRTLAGAFATSLVQTRWANATRENQTELAGAMHQGQSTLDGMIAGGASPESARVMLTNIVEGQSVMLATLNTFAAIVMCFAVAAALIWLAPKPKGPIDTNAGH